jgi:catechol 2,3-dioxygenase-like lactoylglutathione lyase family enzyme
MADLGLTHVALTVSDVDASISFYDKYAHLKVVNRRVDRTTQSDVVWIGDTIHPFVIVLLKMPKVDGALLPESHLGVACESREEVDRLCNQAQSEGILLKGPIDSPPPVGYWAYIRDPDGHTLEISYGQEVESVMKSQSNG